MKTKFAYFFLITLIGCGGGSDNSPDSRVPLPVTTTPKPVVVLPQLASLQLPVPASYTSGSYKANLFSTINKFRQAQGLGPLNHDIKIDLAAANHLAYVETHKSGSDAHNEIYGNVGYTGASPLQRLVAAGYDGTAASEVIGFAPVWPITKYNAADALIATVYHRAILMGQEFTHVGIAEKNDGGPVYINVGFKMAQRNAGDYFSVYPFDGQTDVALNHALESPNPFYTEMEMTHENMCRRTSFPISVASESSSVLTVTAFTVTEDGQTKPVGSRLINHLTTKQDSQYLGKNVAFLVAKEPFKSNTLYQVIFIGKASGTTVGSQDVNFEKAWSFRTGVGDLVNCRK